MDFQLDSNKVVQAKPSTEQNGGVKNFNNKYCNPYYLRTYLLPTLQKLVQQNPESLPFCTGVANLKKAAGYHEIIKHPVCLNTIKTKLNRALYSDAWEYIDDIWLMFENAKLYNEKSSKIYKYCTKLSDIFKEIIDAPMKNLGYCCGQNYVFEPQILYCLKKDNCAIRKYNTYWCYDDRYFLCLRCFHSIQNDTVVLDDATGSTKFVQKEKFIKKRNDVIKIEKFVMCNSCGIKWHRVCALHLDPVHADWFECNACDRNLRKKHAISWLSAKNLEQTKLGSHVEHRVNTFLAKKKCHSKVTIRIVHANKYFCEVKENMAAKYVETGIWPSKFPYTGKTLLAFQNIGDSEVCFFAVYVQEYGIDSSPPNAKKIYISYLDSVHFFEPKCYRTSVYYEIILGYLEHVKNMGFRMVNVWACPPNEGEDFIFYCHPKEQKTPSVKRLQDWYRCLLEKGVKDGIIFKYMNIYNYVVQNEIRDFSQLFCFDEDYWLNALEKQISKDYNTTNSTTMSVEASESKETLNSHATLRDEHYILLRRCKEDFFVIYLYSDEVDSPFIADPDPLFDSKILNKREVFLEHCDINNLEFSSLRRAKYSTMAVLYELHKERLVENVYICHKCKKEIEVRFHCSICKDFDLCVYCYKEYDHEHSVTKINIIEQLQKKYYEKYKERFVMSKSNPNCLTKQSHWASGEIFKPLFKKSDLTSQKDLSTDEDSSQDVNIVNCEFKNIYKENHCKLNMKKKFQPDTSCLQSYNFTQPLNLGVLPTIEHANDPVVLSSTINNKQRVINNSNSFCQTGLQIPSYSTEVQNNVKSQPLLSVQQDYTYFDKSGRTGIPWNINQNYNGKSSSIPIDNICFASQPNHIFSAADNINIFESNRERMTGVLNGTCQNCNRNYATSIVTGNVYLPNRIKHMSDDSNNNVNMFEKNRIAEVVSNAVQNCKSTSTQTDNIFFNSDESHTFDARNKVNIFENERTDMNNDSVTNILHNTLNMNSFTKGKVSYVTKYMHSGRQISPLSFGSFSNNVNPFKTLSNLTSPEEFTDQNNVAQNFFCNVNQVQNIVLKPGSSLVYNKFQKTRQLYNNVLSVTKSTNCASFNHSLHSKIKKNVGNCNLGYK